MIILLSVAYRLCGSHGFLWRECPLAQRCDDSLDSTGLVVICTHCLYLLSYRTDVLLGLPPLLLMRVWDTESFIHSLSITQ